MQYRLLACDIDNTLVPFGGAVTGPKTVRAIRAVQKSGVPFVVSTGRCYAAVSKEALGGLRPDYISCCGGAYVVDAAGRELVRTPLTPEEMYALTDWCENYEFPLVFSYREGYYVYVGFQEFYDAYAFDPRTQQVVLDGEDRNRHLIDMPCAAVCVMTEAGFAAFREKYGYLGLNLFRVASYGENRVILDVVRRGVDKGTGLEALGQVLGIPLEDMVAAGDSENDLRMLQAAGLGCCVADGQEAVKAVADKIIPASGEDGVAALCRELWPQAFAEETV